MSVPFPKKSSMNSPPSVLERSRYRGKPGWSLDWMKSSEAVISRPATRKKVEASNPAIGPAMAKSKRDRSEGGGDLIAVMLDNSPSCMEGRMAGGPTSN